MVKRFVIGFESWAADCVSPIGPAVVEEGIEKLIHCVGESDESFHILATREDGMSCSDDKAPVSIPLKVRNSTLSGNIPLSFLNWYLSNSTRLHLLKSLFILGKP